MTVAIRYFTKFGHTAKMAEVISQVTGVNAETIQTPITNPIDILYLGSGVMLGKISGEMAAFIRTLTPDKVKRVICFGSCAIIKSPVPQMRQLLESQGIVVDDHSFTCRGAMGPLHAGHPDNKDLEDLRKFIQTSIQKKNTMEIKAVKFRKDGFYSQPFVMGGEEGMDKYDKNIRYRGSLQNYLIDTGSEVILVDTGIPAGTPEEVPDENSLAFTGKDICSYMEAFAALGYKPEQVTKILLTHKHSDHSGELRSFPNAKVYVNQDEMDAAELQGLSNLVPVSFNDGPYYNFPESQKIHDGIYLIKAKGHTKGNSIAVVEMDGLFYMLHGDITYVDEALYEDKLSVVFDDLPAARETQNRIREFIRNHPTVYCGTHTPQGYENLEAKRVMDLDNPVPTILAEVDFSEQKSSGKYVCSICGYVYDPAEHDGVAFEDLPDDWKCPRCKQGKEKFNKA